MTPTASVPIGLPLHDLVLPILWAIPTGVVIFVLGLVLSSFGYWRGGWRGSGWSAAFMELGDGLPLLFVAFVLMIVGQIVWGHR